MHEGKKPILTAVSSGQSFSDIQQRLVAEITQVIDRYQFAYDKDGRPNPKMAMSLVRAVADAVEVNYHEQTLEYVSTRLEEQIERYIALGLHDAAGYTEESFRFALAPLVLRAEAFFEYPSKHPMRDGEYTLLLVLPERMVPVRRLLAEFLGGDIPVEFDTLRTEVRANGKVSPETPYILVGINGGRGLKDVSIARADESVERSGCTHMSLHQMLQLFLMRPHFFSVHTDSLLAQSEAVVLGEKCTRGLIKFVARSAGHEVLFVDEKNVHGEVGVGKPYYTTLITA